MDLKQRNYRNPLYAVYLSMKKRCYTPSSSGYKNYGGKGVKVCEEWKSDFSVFYKWAIKNGYSYAIKLIWRRYEKDISNCNFNFCDFIFCFRSIKYCLRIKFI